jgi:3-methyl-2-oxobutanoate hydroxymethyltransferase
LAKKTILDFLEMKEKGEKIVFLTGYNAQMARFEEAVGVDMILVGDSVGNTDLGYDTTLPVTMEDMLTFTAAVRRGAPNTFVVGDMPFMSYQTSVEEAIYNAGRFIKEAGADAVKLEGGAKVADIIRGINDAGILVMGHIGLTPQSAAQFGGWKAQGRNAEQAVSLVKDALALEEAGAFSILVEGVPAPVSKVIRDKCRIPILGIGAGHPCDGQLLIVYDMLGMFEAFKPKFVKRYGNLAQDIKDMLAEYVKDVREEAFPTREYEYGMPKEAQALFEELLEKEGLA